MAIQLVAMKFSILLLMGIILFSSCATSKFVETDLYFGLSKTDGAIISNEDWNQFVRREVSKVYTNGFTELKGEGKWLDLSTNQLAKEPSYIIISVNKMSKGLSVLIDSFRENYKQIFQQQSVLRVDKKVSKISF